jgi:hypothetical protein
MADDIEILTRAFNLDKLPGIHNWQNFDVRASISDIHRLLDAKFIEVVVRSSNIHPATVYRISATGRDVVKAALDHDWPVPEAKVIYDAFGNITGFDDIKREIARAISSRLKVNYLFCGPPACAKSLFLEGISSVIEKNLKAFGSATSASGLSDDLIKKMPTVLLLDEADKLRKDAYSVLLGLMERGDVIEVKYGKSRGVHLETSVFAACNRWEKFTPEFMSRFPWQVHFHPYTRSEFLAVCCGFLGKAGCPEEVANFIGTEVFDNQMGDVRKVRGIYQAMEWATREEAQRIIELQRKYGPTGEEIRVRKQLVMTGML